MALEDYCKARYSGCVHIFNETGSMKASLNEGRTVQIIFKLVTSVQFNHPFRKEIRLQYKQMVHELNMCKS